MRRPLNKIELNGIKPSVAVFGAAGHTGRFVVSELLRRGIAPIAIARDVASFASIGWSDRGVLCREASIDAPDTLARALIGAGAVINCAGPFSETADAVVAAAIRARIHYLDVTAEQVSAQETLRKHDAAARDAGVVIIPAMGFYGGFADLLTTAILGHEDFVEAIEIMVGLDSWHPTRGTRITGERNTSPRVVVTGGKLSPLVSPSPQRFWDFDAPLGRQKVVQGPLSEIILIERHVKAAEIHSWLSQIALDDIRNPTTPPPIATDSIGRSPQRFIVDVSVQVEGKEKRITASGRDIYAFSAPLICEVTARLLDRKFSCTGSHAPGAILDALEVLQALTPEHMSLNIKTS